MVLVRFWFLDSEGRQGKVELIFHRNMPTKTKLHSISPIQRDKKTFTLRDFDLFDFKAGWPLGWPLDLKGLEVLVVEYKVPAAPDPAIYHVGFKRKADQSSGTMNVCT